MDAGEDKLNLLFVDDEKRILLPLKAMFRSNYNVFTTTDAKEALEIAKKENIHIFVSDHRMPEMTGTELLEKVREVSPKTVRILLTGYADLQSIMGAVNNSEVFRFIEKPWDDDKLKNTIAIAADLARELEYYEEDQFHDDSESIEKGESILLIDKTDEITEMLIELFENNFNILHAKDMDTAIDHLEKDENIEVVMVDVQANDDNITAFIHALKKNCPLIPIVVSTPEADADAIVRLINEGQIYRYLPKPIKKGMLKLSIEAACVRYKNYKKQRNLAFLAKQKVADPNINTNIVSKFMDKMNFLKKRIHQILH